MRNLSNYEIVKIAEGMPGGLQGFCKTWGWVQFGRALLTAAAATPPDQDRPDAIAKWGTPPAAEGGIKWQCGPQASGFTAPQTDSQPAQAGRAHKDRTPELHVGDSAFESWYSTYNPAHKSDKQRASDAFAAGVEWEANRRQAETPFAWAEFDGEGGYYLRLYEDNEGYRDEFLKRNPNPIYKTWVFPLVKQK